MQSTSSLPDAGAIAPRAPVHPIVKVAVVAVVAASAVGIWAMTTRSHPSTVASSAAVSTPAEVAPMASNPAPEVQSPSPVEARATSSAAPARSQTTHPKSSGTRASAPAPYQAPSAQAPVQVAAAAPAPVVDPTRGHIESVYVTEQKGESKGVGAVAGGAVGGLVGNSFGRGNGRTAATVLGVVGGALAGNEIEKRARTVKTWHITVRMDDGSTRNLTQSTAPGWRNGDEVRLVDGRLTRPDGSVPAAPKSSTPSASSNDAS